MGVSGELAELDSRPARGAGDRDRGLDRASVARQTARVGCSAALQAVAGRPACSFRLYLSTRLRMTPVMMKLGSVCVTIPIHVLRYRFVGYAAAKMPSSRVAGMLHG